MEYLFAVCSVFSFSHYEVNILLQTQCLSLNFDAKMYISAVRSQNGIEQPLPQSSSRSVYASTGIFLAFLGRGPRALWFGNFIDV